MKHCSYSNRGWLPTWLVAAALFAAASVSAAPVAPASDTGLEPGPEWTSSAQLKSKWGDRPISELRASAEAGDVEAQHYLGWRHAQGEGVPRDLPAAFEWIRKAAEAGFPLAQNNFAVFYESGQVVAQDLNEAARWYRRAADQRLPVALHNLGRLSASGQVSELNPQDARLYYELAAERGDLDAAVALAHSHWSPLGGGRVNTVDAIYWFTFAAENGRVDVYNNIAWFYMDGKQVPRDYDEARRWFAKGAEQGDPYCELGMAMHELRANASAPDLAAARQWMLKAADKNITPAFFQLGRLSELRDIAHKPEVKPDYAGAAEWYKKAADAGDRNAARRLAELTAQGHVPPGL